MVHGSPPSDSKPIITPAPTRSAPKQTIELSGHPLVIQQIVTARRTVREELSNQIIKLLESMPAGYGITVDGFRSQAIARIKALVPEDE